MTDFKTTTIDIEPTWVELLRAVLHTHDARDQFEALKPMAQIADVVRQAQKTGKESVTFTFKADSTDLTIDVKDRVTKRHGIAVRHKKTGVIIKFVECETGSKALKILSGMRMQIDTKNYSAEEEFVEESEIHGRC